MNMPKKGNLSRKMTEFYISYVRVLVKMGSSASMRIRASVHRCSMCSTGCGSPRRKSDGIVVVASGEYHLGDGCLATTRSLKLHFRIIFLHLRRLFISFLVWLWLLEYSLIETNAVIHHLLHRLMTAIVVMI